MNKISTFIHSKRKSAQGYLLPTVILLSFAIGTIGIVSMQAIVSSSTTLNDQYYNTLATEAAQAGAASAASCAKLNQRWVAPAVLTPATNCTGATVPAGAGATAKLPYVAKQDNWESTYEVPPLQDAGATSTVVTSIGKVQLKTSAGLVSRTFTKSVKIIAQTSGASPNVGTISRNVNSLAVGGVSACVAAEGLPYCWGFNGTGQLGTGNRDSSTKPVAVSTNPIQPVQPVAGYCARSINIAGINACVVRVTTIEAQTGSALVNKTTTKVAMGTNYSCAIADGAAYCWGENGAGQLGDGTNNTKLLPVAVFAGPGSPLMGKTVVDIQAGDAFTCALTSEGKVACWGTNAYGQLGDNTRASKNTPTALYDEPAVPASTRIPNPCGGSYVVLNIRVNEPPCTPVPVPAIPASPINGKLFKKLSKASISDHMCAISRDDIAYCWGYNSGGQLGDRTTHARDTKSTSNYTMDDECDESFPAIDRSIDALIPRPIYMGSGSALQNRTITDINVTNDQTSAIADNGRLYSWGGGGTTTGESTSCACTNRPGNTRWHYCRQTYYRDYNLKSTPLGPAYTGTATSFCWATMSACVRTTLLDNKSISMMSTNYGAFCALTGNELYCDGPVYDNYQGQLGDVNIPVGYRTSTNIFTTQSLPHKVHQDDFLRNKTITEIDSGYRSVSLDEALNLFGFFGVNWSAAFRLSMESRAFTCVLADETVGCWGVNNAGQLGTGDLVSRNVPTAVSVDSAIGLPPTAGGGFSDPISF